MSKYFISSGKIKNKNTVYCIGTSSEVNSEYSDILMWYKGDWSIFPTEALLVSSCTTHKNEFVTISEDGLVILISEGSAKFEQIDILEEDFTVRDIKEIDKSLYVVGIGNSIFKRVEENHWEEIGSKKIHNSNGDIAFESIDGFSSNEIYVVGWNGNIWNYHNNNWIKIDSPTNLILTKVLCTSNGNTYICGQSGILLCGRNNNWQTIDTDGVTNDFFDLNFFRSKLYLSSMTNLYQINKEGKLSLVYFDGNIPDSCHKLTSCDDSLWSLGETEIVELRDNQWLKISMP